MDGLLRDLPPVGPLSSPGTRLRLPGAVDAQEVQTTAGQEPSHSGVQPGRRRTPVLRSLGLDHPSPPAPGDPRATRAVGREIVTYGSVKAEGRLLSATRPAKAKQQAATTERHRRRHPRPLRLHRHLRHADVRLRHLAVAQPSECLAHLLDAQEPSATDQRLQRITRRRPAKDLMQGQRRPARCGRRHLKQPAGRGI